MSGKLNKVILYEQSFYLLPERALFWKEASTLIVSDLHFGKAAHFRKAGIPVSDEVFFSDMIHLDKIIHQFNANRLIIVGDMFHSAHNNEVDFFKLWKKHIAEIDVLLVKGNHDILEDKIYQQLSITCFDQQMETGHFVFIHEPQPAELLHNDRFYFFGHVHPKALLIGGGQQHLKLPCFYFSANTCTMPAFSRFSGGSLIKPGSTDRVYVIADNEVVKM